MKLELVDQDLDRVISGAVREAINAHGAIELNLINSVTKRVIASLRNHVIQRSEESYFRGKVRKHVKLTIKQMDALMDVIDKCKEKGVELK